MYAHLKERISEEEKPSLLQSLYCNDLIFPLLSTVHVLYRDRRGDQKLLPTFVILETALHGGASGNVSGLPFYP
jgi:hypothetical protein